jgi:hypothetical protein
MKKWNVGSCVVTIGVCLATLQATACLTPKYDQCSCGVGWLYVGCNMLFASPPASIDISSITYYPYPTSAESADYGWNDINTDFDTCTGEEICVTFEGTIYDGSYACSGTGIPIPPQNCTSTLTTISPKYAANCIGG